MPGYTMITPYENATGGDPRFMHFYEMDTDEPERAFKSMTPLVMERIGGGDTEAFKRWALRTEPAHHVRQHVRPRRRTRGVVSTGDRDFFDVVGRQRACREFADAPVTDDDARAAARRGDVRAERGEPPAVGVRRRARRRDRAPRSATSRATAWEEHGRAFSESRLTPKLLADVDKGATGGIAAAPVHIVVCADIERGLEVTIALVDLPRGAEPAARGDGGSGSAARSTTITTDVPRRAAAGCSASPTTSSPVAVVPLGHPARPLGPPRRDPFARHTHRERYGTRVVATA